MENCASDPVMAYLYTICLSYNPITKKLFETLRGAKSIKHLSLDAQLAAEIEKEIFKFKQILDGTQLFSEEQFYGEEPGLYNFLKFVFLLPTKMSMKTWSTQIDKNHLVMLIDGNLKQSKAPIKIRAYIGPTDLLDDTPPEHWETA